VGYALAVASCSTIHSGIYRRIVAKAWVNAIACHALVNVLSSAWRYSEPLHFLSLFLFSALDVLADGGFTAESAEKVPHHPNFWFSIHRYWQMGLALFALILGGNAIFGFFLLARILSP